MVTPCAKCARVRKVAGAGPKPSHISHSADLVQATITFQCAGMTKRGYGLCKGAPSLAPLQHLRDANSASYEAGPS